MATVFDTNAKAIHHRHRAQTEEDVTNLRLKYQNHTIFNDPIDIWAAIEKLALVVDPTDKQLYNTSQYTHTLQVIEGIERAGINDEEFIITAWIHDLGKLLLLTDEDPANVVCDNFIIREGPTLDDCCVNWNHDEFIYDRFKEIVSPKMAWIIRHHSINLKSCNINDPIIDKHLVPFRKYDKNTKSIYHIPILNLDKHRRLLEKFFPEPIRL